MCNKVGSDPFIVLADADLDAAATRAVKARYIKVGLSCVNAKRFIVEESGADRFVALFVEKAAALKIGDPMERDTSIGPMARGNPQAVWAAPSTNVQLEKRIVLNVALQPHRPK